MTEMHRYLNMHHFKVYLLCNWILREYSLEKRFHGLTTVQFSKYEYLFIKECIYIKIYIEKKLVDKDTLDCEQTKIKHRHIVKNTSNDKHKQINK